MLGRLSDQKRAELKRLFDRRVQATCCLPAALSVPSAPVGPLELRAAAQWLSGGAAWITCPSIHCGWSDQILTRAWVASHVSYMRTDGGLMCVVIRADASLKPFLWGYPGVSWNSWNTFEYLNPCCIVSSRNTDTCRQIYLDIKQTDWFRYLTDRNTNTYRWID